MRTTVEMKAEHRSALLALAANRGEKGFSSILAEAIQAYLDEEKERRRRREKFISLAGSVSEEEASELRASVLRLRENWR
jgi:metal-responsive CopG/Arc/MetJ family transcriptional regulator